MRRVPPLHQLSNVKLCYIIENSYVASKDPILWLWLLTSRRNNIALGGVYDREVLGTETILKMSIVGWKQAVKCGIPCLKYYIKKSNFYLLSFLCIYSYIFHLDLISYRLFF